MQPTSPVRPWGLELTCITTDSASSDANVTVARRETRLSDGLRSTPEGPRMPGAQVWHVEYIPGAADSGDQIGVTCPTGAAHEGGERDRHCAAFEEEPRNDSESPQPARMVGETTAGRREVSVPDRQMGPVQSCSAASFGSPVELVCTRVLRVRPSPPAAPSPSGWDV